MRTSTNVHRRPKMSQVLHFLGGRGDVGGRCRTQISKRITFSRAREGVTSTNVHHVHPDQIERKDTTSTPLYCAVAS